MIRLLLILSFFVASVSGCQTRSDATVLERSAEERPVWADGDFSEEGKAETYLVYKREEIYRLELGIKQAQAAAIRRTKDLVLERARVELAEVGDDVSKGNLSLVYSEISRAVEEVHNSVYSPEDAVSRNVYWENVRRDTSEGPLTYYNVYVLLTVPRQVLDVALFRVAKELNKSQNADAKLTADTVLKDLSRFEDTPANEVKE